MIPSAGQVLCSLKVVDTKGGWEADFPSRNFLYLTARGIVNKVKVPRPEVVSPPEAFKSLTLYLSTT